MKNRIEFQYAFEETNQTKYKNLSDLNDLSLLKFSDQKNSQKFEKENIDINLNSDQDRKNKEGGKFKKFILIILYI